MSTELRTMADLGFTTEDTWKVAICDHCHFIVDKSMIIDHIKGIHRLEIRNVNAVLLVLRMNHLRIHLPVIWDDNVDDQLDDSEEEDRGPSFFHPPAFRPGSAALQGIPVHDGFKCQLCEQRLHHACTITKKGMRTHYSRYHGGQSVEYHPAKFQAFYGRSKIASQLRYVEVMDIENQRQDSITPFGIPENIPSVPNHSSTITAKRDLNQFGVNFQVYPLLETLDLSDLGPLLYSPHDRSFELCSMLHGRTRALDFSLCWVKSWSASERSMPLLIHSCIS
ncbi:hypothetical protein V1508DRAFT_362467 [Lipomyces doorenjongii]|uniref:uncharacterized protein n=1 Tax=Lipomyces doorenjongii TaxID=383834 RepID=UPI0034CEDC1D